MAITPKKVPSVKLGSKVSPVGSALFVSAPRASQFSPDKQEAGLVLSAEDYAMFMAEIMATLKEHESELPAPITKLAFPFKEQTDAEGNPTGEMILKTKTAMRFPAKFYDVDGKEFKPSADFQVANRAKIRLAVGLEVMKTSMYCGVVARLNGIKIISSSPWANSNPFGDTHDEGDFSYGDSPVEDADDSAWVD